MKQHGYCRVSKDWIPYDGEVEDDTVHFVCDCGKKWSDDYIAFTGNKTVTEKTGDSTVRNAIIGSLLLLNPVGALLGAMTGGAEYSDVPIPPKHCNQCGYDDCYPTFKEAKGKFQFQCERCREYTWRT